MSMQTISGERTRATTMNVLLMPLADIETNAKFMNKCESVFEPKVELELGSGVARGIYAGILNIVRFLLVQESHSCFFRIPVSSWWNVELSQSKHSLEILAWCNQYLCERIFKNMFIFMSSKLVVELNFKLTLTWLIVCLDENSTLRTYSSIVVYISRNYFTHFHLSLILEMCKF